MPDQNIAAEKAEKLSKLLADLEAGKDISADAEAIGAKRINADDEIDMPTSKIIWVSCSGCGCACHIGEGAGKGCGQPNMGQWV